MSALELEAIPDGRWPEQVAGRWVTFMEGRPAARLCLPTGETPQPVYANAAANVDLSRCEVFLLDEFGLPPGDPARCDQMFERDFLALLDNPPMRVHNLNPQAADLEEECRRFEQLVDERSLDLTLLGLGGNGHLGLNEPGSAADAPTRIVQLEASTAMAAGRYGSGTLPEWGMTLGLRSILASREIWLLVTGAHKAGILERVLHGPVDPDVPGSFLQNHPNALVLADESAAGSPSAGH